MKNEGCEMHPSFFVLDEIGVSDTKEEGRIRLDSFLLLALASKELNGLADGLPWWEEQFFHQREGESEETHCFYFVFLLNYLVL